MVQEVVEFGLHCSIGLQTAAEASDFADVVEYFAVAVAMLVEWPEKYEKVQEYSQCLDIKILYYH